MKRNLQFTIYNFQKKNVHSSLFIVRASHADRETGFTLIELLVVIAVMAVVGAMAVIIMVTSFRTSTKTNSINSEKENGNYVITQMENTIRYASSVQCASSAPFTSIVVTSVNNSQTTYDCTNNNAGASLTAIESNG